MNYDTSWHKYSVKHEGAGYVDFRYREIIDVIRSIFKQPSHAPYIVYTPQKDYREENSVRTRIYSEAYTARRWEQLQVKFINIGHFVIPIDVGSDETFQTNFSGDKNIWPMTTSVMNIPTPYRNKIVTAAWRLLALLPIRPKRASKKSVDDEKTSALQTVQAVLDLVLRDLRKLWITGMEVLCPDGKIRIGHPVLFSWLGDYPEFTKLFTTSYMSCPVCMASAEEMAS
ncbi:hypothetical protein BJ508DRAFT_219118, partial [Ascobolus immersus RN42]